MHEFLKPADPHLHVRIGSIWGWVVFHSGLDSVYDLAALGWVFDTLGSTLTPVAIRMCPLYPITV